MIDWVLIVATGRRDSALSDGGKIRCASQVARVFRRGMTYLSPATTSHD